MLEAVGVDFGGNVVIPDLPPRAGNGLALAAPGPAIRNPLPLSSAAGTVYESESGARTPAIPPGNIVLLSLREERLSICQQPGKRAGSLLQTAYRPLVHRLQ